MRLLTVTSFGPEMYEASGRRLVRSFIDRRTEGDLLICTEQNAASRIRSRRVIRYVLEESGFLRTWLEENRAVIPPHLGGTAPKCACRARDAFRGHKEACVWGWWNKNASRWFRKVVAMEYAAGLAYYDAFLWLDSDCYFKRRLRVAEVESWFGDASVFLLKGSDRVVVESGVLGFRGEQGRRFIRLTAERFRSGAFREDWRWDDGYQFQQVLDSHPEISRVDLATHITGQLHVVCNSPVAAYIEHDKGLHARLGVTY